MKYDMDTQLNESESKQTISVKHQHLHKKVHLSFQCRKNTRRS